MYMKLHIIYLYFLQLRTVTLRRTSDGNLGLSIKGGKDDNLPILISKVCRNEEDDHLYIGDAIVKGDIFIFCYNKPEQAIELHSNPNKKKIIEKNFKNRKLDRKSGFQGKTGSRTKFVRQYFCIQKLPRPCRVQIYTY